MADVLDLTGDGGVLKKVIRKAKPGALHPSENLPNVDVHYEGKLADTGDLVLQPAHQYQIGFCFCFFFVFSFIILYSPRAKKVVGFFKDLKCLAIVSFFNLKGKVR